MAYMVTGVAIARSRPLGASRFLSATVRESFRAVGSIPPVDSRSAVWVAVKPAVTGGPALYCTYTERSPAPFAAAGATAR